MMNKLARVSRWIGAWSPELVILSSFISISMALAFVPDVSHPSSIASNAIQNPGQIQRHIKNNYGFSVAEYQEPINNETHESITFEAIKSAYEHFNKSRIVYRECSGCQEAARQIIRSNVNVDNDQISHYKHFDSESFEEGQKRVIDLFQQICNELHARDYLSARSHLGEALHAIQDFYSHTNWVELNKDSPRINDDLGIPGKQLKFISRDEAACNSQHELVANGLTSGYYCFPNRVNGTNYDPEKCVQLIPPKKCRHGSGGDYKSYNDGINKDSGLGFASQRQSGYHSVAAKLAGLATIRYLEQIKGQVNSDEFERLLGPASNEISATYQLKLSSVIRQDDVWSDEIEKWARSWIRESNGEYGIRHYENGRLSRDEEILNQKLRTEQFDMAMLSTLGLSYLVPSVMVLDLPGLTDNYEEHKYLIEDVEIQKEFQRKFEEKGFSLLSFGILGRVRLFTSCDIKVYSEFVKKEIFVGKEMQKIFEYVYDRDRQFSPKMYNSWESLAGAKPQLEVEALDISYLNTDKYVYGSPYTDYTPCMINFDWSSLSGAIVAKRGSKRFHDTSLSPVFWDRMSDLWMERSKSTNSLAANPDLTMIPFLKKRNRITNIQQNDLQFWISWRDRVRAQMIVQYGIPQDLLDLAIKTVKRYRNSISLNGKK